MATPSQGMPGGVEDWRTQLSSEDRNTLVQKIVMVLKECVTDPNTNADDSRLSNLAAKFEETVYQNAPNKNTYFTDIAKKMYHLKAKSSTAGANRRGAVPTPNGLPVPQMILPNGAKPPAVPGLNVSNPAVVQGFSNQQGHMVQLQQTQTYPQQNQAAPGQLNQLQQLQLNPQLNQQQLNQQQLNQQQLNQQMNQQLNQPQLNQLNTMNQQQQFNNQQLRMQMQQQQQQLPQKNVVNTTGMIPQNQMLHQQQPQHMQMQQMQQIHNPQLQQIHAQQTHPGQVQQIAQQLPQQIQQISQQQIPQQIHQQIPQQIHQQVMQQPHMQQVQPMHQQVLTQQHQQPHQQVLSQTHQQVQHPQQVHLQPHPAAHLQQTQPQQTQHMQQTHPNLQQQHLVHNLQQQISTQMPQQIPQQMSQQIPQQMQQLQHQPQMHQAIPQVQQVHHQPQQIIHPQQSIPLHAQQQAQLQAQHHAQVQAQQAAQQQTVAQQQQAVQQAAQQASQQAQQQAAQQQAVQQQAAQAAQQAQQQAVQAQQQAVAQQQLQAQLASQVNQVPQQAQPIPQVQPLPQGASQLPGANITNVEANDKKYYDKWKHMQQYIRSLEQISKQIERLLEVMAQSGNAGNNKQENLESIHTKTVYLQQLLHASPETHKHPRNFDMLVGAEKQILSWIQQMKQTPAKQDPKRPANRVAAKPAEQEEKPVELEPWAQLVEQLSSAAKDSRMAVASELQVVSAKLEGGKQQPFDFAKYLPVDPVAVKTEKPPSPPAMTQTNQVNPHAAVVLVDLVPALPEQRWKSQNIVSKQGAAISLAVDPLAKKRRTTNNTDLTIQKHMVYPESFSDIYSLKDQLHNEKKLSLIVGPMMKHFTKRALLEEQPDLEPLPDIAPDWDGSDDFSVDCGAGNAATRGVQDAVVPVKHEPIVKREAGKEERGEVGMKRKHVEGEDKCSKVLTTYKKYLSRWKDIKSEVDVLQKQGFKFAVIPNTLGTTLYLKAVPRFSSPVPPTTSATPSSSSRRIPSDLASLPSPAFYLFVPRYDNEPIRYSFSTELQCILEATKRENPSHMPAPVTHTNHTLPPTSEANARVGTITSATDKTRETTRDSLRSMVRRFEAHLAQVASPLTITSLGRTWANVVNDVVVGAVAS